MADQNLVAIHDASFLVVGYIYPTRAIKFAIVKQS